jgi:hypothetical protein
MQRIFGEYIWFWLTLLVSIGAYIPLYLCSRGNITVNPDVWWKFSIHRAHKRDLARTRALGLIAYAIRIFFTLEYTHRLDHLATLLFTRSLSCQSPRYDGSSSYKKGTAEWIMSHLRPLSPLHQSTSSAAPPTSSFSHSLDPISYFLKAIHLL